MAGKGVLVSALKRGNPRPCSLKDFAGHAIGSIRRFHRFGQPSTTATTFSPSRVTPSWTLNLTWKCHRNITTLKRGFPSVTSPKHEGNGAIDPSIKGTAGNDSPQPNSPNAPGTLSSDWRRDLAIIKQLAVYLWPSPSSPTTMTPPGAEITAGGTGMIKTRMITSLALLLGGKVLNVTVPFFFKEAIDLLNIPLAEASTDMAVTTLSMAGTVLIGYGAARLGSALFQEIRNAIFGTVAQSAIRSAARNIFCHLHRLDYAFHLTRQTGGLVRAIDRGTKGINQILSSLVFHIFPTLLEIGMVCGILSYSYGPSYAVVTLVTMAGYTAFTVATTAWRASFRKAMNAADNAAANRATDSLLNFEAVKYFNNESFELAKYDAALSKYEAAAIKNTSSLAFLNAGQNFIFSAALTTMMYMASFGVVQGALTVGDLVMINGLVFQLSLPLNFLGSVYRETRQSLLDMDYMFSLQNYKSTIPQPPSAPELCVKGGSIRFEKVNFGYTNERSLLKDLSLDIPAGASVAFVGPSGCGKSTVLRLLLRLYDPGSGRIYIDGQDITHVALPSLRSHLGVVPQDIGLFNQTVAYNIAYGRVGASDEEVQAAARKAAIHDTIMTRFPQGYDTVVGERGLLISGGEKQRLQLARAFLKNPPILLFDEATSALDQGTESAIIQTIDAFLNSGDQRKTAIFIAHRLATIKDCDIIFVMEDGHVVEQGAHEDLLAKQGVYAKLWKTQASKMA